MSNELKGKTLIFKFGRFNWPQELKVEKIVIFFWGRKLFICLNTYTYIISFINSKNVFNVNQETNYLVKGFWRLSLQLFL